MSSVYDNTGLYISFLEFNPADPAEPGSEYKGKILGQGIEYLTHQLVTEEQVPSVTTTHSDGGSSTAAAHTITHTRAELKPVQLFYVYSQGGEVKKTLPEHIRILINRAF